MVQLNVSRKNSCKIFENVEEVVEARRSFVLDRIVAAIKLHYAPGSYVSWLSGTLRHVRDNFPTKLRTAACTGHTFAVLHGRGRLSLDEQEFWD